MIQSQSFIINKQKYLPEFQTMLNWLLLQNASDAKDICSFEIDSRVPATVGW